MVLAQLNAATIKDWCISYTCYYRLQSLNYVYEKWEIECPDITIAVNYDKEMDIWMQNCGYKGMGWSYWGTYNSPTRNPNIIIIDGSLKINKISDSLLRYIHQHLSNKNYCLDNVLASIQIC
jgi:hypothetical protein